MIHLSILCVILILNVYNTYLHRSFEFVYPYLEVGELRVIKVGVDVQCGAHHQQRLKLV